MTITYFKREVYGIPRIYLANQEQKQLIAILTNSTCISNKQVWALKELGVQFKEIPDPRSGNKKL